MSAVSALRRRRSARDQILARTGLGHDRQLFAAFRWPAVPPIAEIIVATAKKWGFGCANCKTPPPVEAGSGRGMCRKMLKRQCLLRYLIAGDSGKPNFAQIEPQERRLGFKCGLGISGGRRCEKAMDVALRLVLAAVCACGRRVILLFSAFELTRPSALTTLVPAACHGAGVFTLPPLATDSRPSQRNFSRKSPQ
jgi:hypothetical protein